MPDVSVGEGLHLVILKSEAKTGVPRNKLHVEAQDFRCNTQPARIGAAISPEE
jgi:hypothetical protein